MKATQPASQLQAGDQIEFGTVLRTYNIVEVNRVLIVYLYQGKKLTLEVHEGFTFTIYNAPTPKISEGVPHSSPCGKTPPV